MESEMKLELGMPLKLRESLATGTFNERNAYVSWNRLSGKTVFLIGWCETAFAVVENLGDYDRENISGHPSFLFEPACQPGNGLSPSGRFSHHATGLMNARNAGLEEAARICAMEYRDNPNGLNEIGLGLAKKIRDRFASVASHAIPFPQTMSNQALASSMGFTTAGSDPSAVSAKTGAGNEDPAPIAAWLYEWSTGYEILYGPTPLDPSSETYADLIGPNAVATPLRRALGVVQADNLDREGPSTTKPPMRRKP